MGLGTERLCFDVFSDTVNTASRVMTGIPPDTDGGGYRVAVSVQFKRLAEACASPNSLLGEGTMCSLLCLGDAVSREAKGKGAIDVHPVLLRSQRGDDSS